MIIPLGTDDWESMSEDISRIKLHNMYIAENVTSPDGKTRVSRPTLTPYLTLPSSGISGMWRQDGTINGDWFVIAGSILYRVTATKAVVTIGAITGGEYYQFAGTADRVIVVSGGVAFSTDGLTLTTVSMPGGEGVGSVAAINDFFILSVLNDDQFYWIVPGGIDPLPLDFATAERFPDPIMSVNILSDEIWFIGSAGPEVWSTTNDADAPFIRIPARVYNEGCAAKTSVVAVTANDNPGLMWVTDNRAVVLAQGGVTRVSNESVEELLKTATNLRAYGFRYNRHDFYILTADELTLAFDITMKTWSRWDSYGYNNWRAHLGGQVGSTVLAGDYTSAVIYELEEGVTDDGQPVVREVSGGVPNTASFLPCKNVVARVNAGWSPSYGFIPTLELRWSDDQGETYSNYRAMPMGDRGRYNTDVLFRSVGKIDRPGRIFEFRFSDPARFRLDYATINEG